MRYSIYVLLCVSVLALFSNCTKKKSYNDKEFSYYDGDGEVKYYQSANIDYDINGNLVVDGNVTLTDSLKISSDLNINPAGKVIMETETAETEIIVFGNVNITDTLFIYKGTLRIIGDFNINVGGFLNVTDFAKVIVEQNLNQNGYLYGLRNIYILGEYNPNNERVVFMYPYEDYPYEKQNYTVDKHYSDLYFD